MNTESMPLETQIDTLGKCGIRPKPGINIDDLLSMFPREEYENEPFTLLLTVLGSEADSGAYLSDDIWYLDTECIAEDGDYIRIAKRMVTLARPLLPIFQLRDQVDLQGGRAWLSFVLNGKEVRWDAMVDGDWIDPAIVSNFVALLADQKSDMQFTYLNLEGQDCIIGCSNKETFSQLRTSTHLDFQWLQ